VIVLLVAAWCAPFAAAPLARRAVDRFEPVAALRALTAASVALAGCCLAALGGLLLAGALGVPFLAATGKLVRPLSVGPDVLVYPAAVLSAAALAVCAGTAARSALAQARLLRAARGEVARGHGAGDVTVVDDERADAYALPGRRGTPGRIVVTSGMLRSLTAGEREAVFAHERAHLAGRHHLYLAAAELAAHCHPALRPMGAAVALAAERAADEAAAHATGDRRTTAHAVGRAALAARVPAGARPAFLPSAAAGPVPHRVAALLRPPCAPRSALSAVALLLLLCTGAALGTASAGAISLHTGVEVAQGEGGHRTHHHVG
jgi:Peptidase family M48